MIITDLHHFSHKNILFLQGPVGPFFRRIAKQLRDVGAHVHKINFNAGDWFFWRQKAINFRQHPDQWEAFFEEKLKELAIDYVVLFGDCRPIHKVARQVALKNQIDFFVFEEGYVRPNFVTFERFGVNDNSHLPRQAEFYLSNGDVPTQPEQELGYTFHMICLWGFLYFSIALLLRPLFKQYRHHRPVRLYEGWIWLRGFARKFYYGHKERHMLKRFTGPLAKSFYMVPLQVYNDSQIHTHSDFRSVKMFIRHVVKSFAKHAPSHTHLLFKHHPMDRGYNDYTEFMHKLAKKYNLEGRLHYAHDLHLPSLLNEALGTIVVNSTIGFSSLYHDCPVKVCGRAIYDMEGLTFQGPLEDFWEAAPKFQINRKLFTRFRNYLILTTQINGNFYKRLKTPYGRYHLTYEKVIPEDVTVHPYAFIDHSHKPETQ